MERKSRIGSLVVVSAMALACGVSGCAKLKARDDLNKGVQAYKNAQFDRAIEYFKESAQLDPTLMNARIYLATAYASQYIPGAPSEENKRNGTEAIKEFKGILKIEPNNLSAIDGIGSLLFQIGSNPFDPQMIQESKTYHEQHIKLKPDDAQPYYWIGVIDWTLAYRANKALRADYNDKARKRIGDLDPLPPKLRDEFTKEQGDTVDEGMNALKKAIELKPDYANAMAYLNLLLRQKADMETTPEARDADEKLADSLVDKVKEINQKQMTAPVRQ